MATKELKSLTAQFDTITKDYKKKMFIGVEEALDDASLEMQKALEQQSPMDTNSQSSIRFKDSWDRKMQYKAVRYIGNTKTVSRNKKDSGQKGGIPLSSLLEFGRKGRPFIQKTFNANIGKVIRIFINKLGGKV